LNSLTNFAITHEVGAANLLYPYLKAEFPETLCIATGPSVHLPTRYGLKNIKIGEVSWNVNTEENTIFLGSTPSNFESVVVPALKNLEGFPSQTVLVLDNWVNYESRIAGLTPDSVIVFDEYAQKYASAVFHKCPNGVVQVNNYFLDDCKKRFLDKFQPKNRILFIEVPFNSFTDYTFSEGYSFCICNQLNRLCEQFPNMQIVYRRHPSGVNIDCFERFNIDFPNLGQQIVLSENNDILDDLVNAGFVVGLPSYALFLAQSLGLQVFSAEDTNENWHGPLFQPLNSIA
jgi:hypothetical protein